MLYIPNPYTDPYYNQAFEQAVFELCTEGDILLLWQNNSAVVCGRNQNVFAEICVPEAERRGVSVVRRDTGGGTVYHDEGNINYTIITDSKGGAVDYDTPISVMVSALNALGIPAYKNRTCDIAIDGKKISGSAQRQTKTRVLHHGTLLYETDLNALRLFSQGLGGMNSKAVSSDRCEVANISDYVRFSSVAELRGRLANIICDRAIMPTEGILSLAGELRVRKYAAFEWTYGKNPSFRCTRESGDISVDFSAKHGIITDFSLSCPYAQSKGEEFIGQPLATGTIKDVCKKITDSEHAKVLFGLIFGEI